MKLSNLTQCAIAALPALWSATEPVAYYRVAQDYQLSPRMVQSAFHKLQTAGILKGRRGPRGGYVLARSPDQITMVAWIEAIEGPLFGGQDVGELQEYVNRLLGRAAWRAANHCTLDDLRRAVEGREAP